jgi:GTP pyrophosphokinase
VVDAADRQGLLRDISDVLSREKINVTAVKTQSRAGTRAHELRGRSAGDGNADKGVILAA